MSATFDKPQTKLSRMAELKALHRERGLSSSEAEELANLLPPDYSIYGVGQGYAKGDDLTEEESLAGCFHHAEVSMSGLSRGRAMDELEDYYEGL